MREKYEAIIEGILFAMGEAVSVSVLAKAMEISEMETIDIISSMQKKYQNKNRGIEIIKIDGSYQMCSKKECYEIIAKVVTQPKKHILTDAVLETLSIVAYKQPITKQEIERIRGVKCDHVINRLIEYNLIYEVGRLDTIGRPILFATTEEFLRCFGICSLEEMPEMKRK